MSFWNKLFNHRKQETVSQSQDPPFTAAQALEQTKVAAEKWEKEDQIKRAQEPQRVLDDIRHAAKTNKAPCMYVRIWYPNTTVPTLEELGYTFEIRNEKENVYLVSWDKKD